MDDCISREELISIFKDTPLEDFAINKIKSLPTLDAVPVVRCKDCKHYRSGIDINGKPFTRCDGSIRTYGQTNPDWFCADGEKVTE